MQLTPFSCPSSVMLAVGCPRLHTLIVRSRLAEAKVLVSAAARRGAEGRWGAMHIHQKQASARMCGGGADWRNTRTWRQSLLPTSAQSFFLLSPSLPQQTAKLAWLAGAPTPVLHPHRTLWVEHQLHDVVRVALEHLGARPALVPVPQLDQHVVGAGEAVGQRGVHRDVPAGRG